MVNYFYPKIIQTFTFFTSVIENFCNSHKTGRDGRVETGSFSASRNVFSDKYSEGEGTYTCVFAICVYAAINGWPRGLEAVIHL